MNVITSYSIHYTKLYDNYLNPITLRDSNFYKNNYSNNPKTFDSCSYVSHENVFRLRLEEIPGKFPGFGAYGGIGFNYYKNYYFNKDSIFRNSHSNYFRDRYLEAGIYRLQSKRNNFVQHTLYEVIRKGNTETDGGHKLWLNDGYGNFTDSGQDLGNGWNTGMDTGDIDNDGVV